MGGACSTYRRYRNVYIILVRKYKGTGSLGKPRSRWEDELQLYFKRTEYGVEWI
jgi:hypothetical protein